MVSQRGISPLIATVLILGFTVALAAVIMTWGTGFTKRMTETTEETAERRIAFSTDVMVNIKSAKLIGNKVKLLIENSGSRDIEKFNVRVYGAEGVDSVETSSGVEAYDIQSIEAEFNPSKTGVVEKVEAFPAILLDGEIVVSSATYDKEEEVSLDESGESLVLGQNFEVDDDDNGIGDPWIPYHSDPQRSLVGDSAYGEKAQRILAGDFDGGSTSGGIAQTGFAAILQVGHTYRVDLYYKAISGTGSFGLACLQNGYGDCIFAVPLSAPEANKWYSNGATFTVDYPRDVFYIWANGGSPFFEFYVDAVQIYEVT